MAAYTVENLSFTYPEGEKRALKDLSFTVEEGEFLLLCGQSGCGKSTLLRHLKTVLTPHGKREGRILFGGKPLENVDFRQQSSEIGFVQQDPENQIVTDKVWHELAFGLESLGMENSRIRLRVAEMANFFGIQNWFYKPVTDLSGGQKQLLNLASVMAIGPSVLILDEPTSQLDPIAAAEFLDAVRKINREVGATVILSEHRLEEAFPLADRVLVLEEGEAAAFGTPAEAALQLRQQKSAMTRALPAPARIWSGLEGAGECPLTVRDGRRFLEEHYEPGTADCLPEEKKPDGASALELKEVWFRYEKNGEDVLKDLSLQVPGGTLFAVVGGNGSGKSTMLSVLCGIRKPYRGKILYDGKPCRGNPVAEKGVCMLPQDPKTLFVKNTVELDLAEALSGLPLSKEEKNDRICKAASQTRITHLLARHPYDLSGGEQQRAALAKLLILRPRILLLDEPTKGMDAAFKEEFAAILKELTEEGKTIVLVSHDVEFCAEYADLCAMFFDGSVLTTEPPRKFFSGNTFYTTAACRMARRVFPGAVTCQEVIRCCRN